MATMVGLEVTMPENGLPERVDPIEQKLHARFLEIRNHFVAQRKQIDVVFDRLSKQLDRRIGDSERTLTEGRSRVERTLDQFIESQSRPRSRATTSRRLRPPKRRR